MGNTAFYKSLKVAVQGPVFMAHPLHIHTYNTSFLNEVANTHVLSFCLKLRTCNVPADVQLMNFKMSVAMCKIGKAIPVTGCGGP
jgi:ssRNA-specific RNase YbeY (16S rRNA maturation enzyme)